MKIKNNGKVVNMYVIVEVVGAISAINVIPKVLHSYTYVSS